MNEAELNRRITEICDTHCHTRVPGAAKKIRELIRDVVSARMPEAAREPMETVVQAPDSILAYPDVTPRATRWVFSDTPILRTLLVTEHGLRRLLRVASKAWGITSYVTYQKSGADAQLLGVYERCVTPERLAAMRDELSSIFCEGTLVMSRLFVDDEGRAIAHPDDEVDDASIPPWERPAESERGAGVAPERGMEPSPCPLPCDMGEEAGAVSPAIEATSAEPRTRSVRSEDIDP